MSSPPNTAGARPDVVLFGDGAPADDLRARLAPCDVALQVLPSTAACLAELAAQGWVLIESTELRRLIGARDAATTQAHVANSGDSTSTVQLPDEATFLRRADELLRLAQPPNDQLALLYVHLAITPGDENPRALLEAEIVRRLRLSVRDRDALAQSTRADVATPLAQVGEREYCILLPNLARPHMAFKIAQRVREKFAEPIRCGNVSYEVRATVGIALHPADARDAAELLGHARNAQRAALADATSGVRFHQPSVDAAAVQRLRLEAALVHAIERGELSVHYQPKVRLSSGKIVGAEALVRWRNPELGQVSPVQFIPVAEETGLILSIGEHVLTEACLQAKRWLDDGLPPLRMAVNLSTIQLRDPHLLDMLQRVLRETGLPASELELEITESVLLQNAEATIDALERIKGLGIHLAIDDFGTGYSSLAYLKRFPIDTLKIDQSFVRDLTTNPDDAALTTSIILMGKSLGLNVIAEGVETRSQVAFLQVLECDEAQGYLFGKPMDATAMKVMLETGIDPALMPPTA